MQRRAKNNRVFDVCICYHRENDLNYLRNIESWKLFFFVFLKTSLHGLRIFLVWSNSTELRHDKYHEKNESGVIKLR